jgi:hypothetical protein
MMAGGSIVAIWGDAIRAVAVAALDEELGHRFERKEQPRYLGRARQGCTGQPLPSISQP